MRSDVMAELREARIAEREAYARTEARLDATAARLDALIEQVETLLQQLDTSAELLGECMPVVSPDTQEMIAEAVSDWPADTLRHFNESERGARAAEASGANAKLRRAS